MNDKELLKPLNPANISTREQSGQKLNYVEGHHAIREANRIFGFDGWTRSTGDYRIVQDEQKQSRNGKDLWYVGYTCTCVVTVEGVTRDGVGFGQGIDSDHGKAHESAIKEAQTDAMKRALMTFGDPFGLALYDKEQAHVGVAHEKPDALPPTASPDERKRNAELYWARQIMDGALKTTDGRALSKDRMTTLRGMIGSKDVFDVLLDAEQNDVTTYDDLILFVQGAKEAA